MRLVDYLTMFIGLMLIGYISTNNVIGASKNRSYVATMSEVSFMPNGKPALSETITYASASNGSRVRIRPFLKPDLTESVIQRTIIDLNKGEEIVVDGLTETVSTYRLTPEQLQYMKFSDKCVAPEKAITEKIAGFEAVKFTSDIKQGNHLRRIEMWKAPDLDCLSLRETMYFGASEADLKVQHAKEIKSISLIEPDSSLFSIPVSYKERSPSARRDEFHRLYPNSPRPDCLKDTDKAHDKIYFARHP